MPFNPRFNEDLKGDIQLIGNNILGPDNNAFNDGSVYNHNVDMVYIDIDGDPTTFSSSSANLDIPNPGCYKIIHASLYWSAVTEGTESFTNVKFKGPSGGYNDVVGTVIFDANGTSVDRGDSFPYACYADVTSIVTNLATDLGTYTVANVSSAQGETDLIGNTTGNSAGWSLFIVYEDPTKPGKSITSFDGFSAISTRAGNPSLDIPVSGFRTVPAPAPVRANFAFAALEGDSPIRGDQLLLNNVNLSTADRSASNFFNSSVTQLNALPVSGRNPNSSNTLGFDTGVMVVPNPSNTVIANDAVAATVTLSTTGDTYFPYFYAFAVEIIEPNIVLTKIVEDVAGNDIGGQLVNLGDELNYVIGFQNTGNDNATSLTIRDVLPINIVFDYPSDIVSLPSGVSVQSYNPATREIIFAVDNSIVKENDPVQEIRFKVTVVSTCSLLTDACSNIISNQAFSTYNGTLNPTFTISDDPSYSTNTGCLLTPKATNFLADINCVFEEEVILCGASTVLTAGNGYDQYSWSTSPSGTPVIGTTQSITVTDVGTYYVHNSAIAPCQDTDQVFEVITFGANVTNPLLPLADQVVTCPNDGKELPNFFLCGSNDSRPVQTGITDASSIIWERLDETSCDAVVNQDCANESSSCVWNQVETGPDYLIDTSGQYRLTLNYSGGCFNQFYFNVYENLLVPTATSQDIVCTTPGQITISGVPSGYEYSIDGANYQASNVFSINNAGIYTIYIRQVDVMPNPCIFTVPDIQIRERDFTVSNIITQPYCNGELGNITVAANDARPQYFFSISQGATLVNSVGPIVDNHYDFENLNPGTYTINVSTEDGCIHTEDIEIINPPLLTATSALTKPLTCTDGEITVYPDGGTPPYFYFVNSTTNFQTTPIIDVTASGTFNITVVDSNNCSANTSITVTATEAPDFNVTKTDILCVDDGDAGVISINVTNANGNTLEYSIDNGVTFVNSSVFSGLSAGDYDVIVQYSTSGDVCATTPQRISINAATAISGTATLTTPYTCTTNGEITVSGVTGGTAPYQYSIDGITFQSGLTFSNLTDGSYTVTVRDANNCTLVTAPIIIDALDPPTDLSFSSLALTCPTNTTNVTITTTGGVGTLEYQIIAPSGSVTAYQASNVFSNLTSGTYTFQVRDQNHCVYSESYNITPLPTLNIVGQAISDITCLGSTDGTAQFNISGTTNFTYTINGGSSTVGTSQIDLTGLAAGDYTIIVTDTDTNCQETETISISAPTTALNITLTVSPITCDADGNVVINAVGGWGSYVYTLTLPDNTVLPGQTSNTFSNLSQQGTHIVTVEDAKGCVVTNTFALNTPTAPSATLDVSSNYCYDATTGSNLQVNATGGQAPYEYNINGGPFTSNNTFNNLTPGTYTISVRDSYGCTITLPAETIEAELMFNTVLNKDIDCTTSPDASITGTFSGGYAPFTYAVSFNGGAYSDLGTTTSPFTYTTATDGTYQFQITDSRGCTVESTVSTVNAITLPEITSVTQTQPVLCYGDANAAIQITINNAVGTPDFTINVNNDTTGTDYGTQTSGLPAGTYTITLTDSKSCTDTETIIIAEPNAVSFDLDKIDITCDVNLGSSLGAITVENVSGGTAPFTYYITNNFGDAITGNPYIATTGENHTFTIINFGTYTINVVDDNGCSLSKQIVIASPPSDLDIDVATTVPDCVSGGTAEITAISALGSGDYEFGILEFNTAPYTLNYLAPDTPGGSVRTFTNLIPGVLYSFVVHDRTTNCYFVKTADTPIAQASTLTSTLDPHNVVCIGENNGSVTFTLDNFDSTTSSIDYTIRQAYTNTVISGPINLPVTFGVPETVTTPSTLSLGQYYIAFTENGSGAFNGCQSASAIFEITESSVDLDVSASVDRNANCNTNSGLVSAIATHGTAPYLYQLTTSSTPPLRIDSSWNTASTFNVDANSYFAHVMDANGCIKTTGVIVLPNDPQPIITASLNNQCTVNEGEFEIDVNLTTSGVGPYSYSVDGGAFQTRTAPFTISNLSSGTHTVEVQDSNGCGNMETVLIETPIGITPAVTALPTCLNNDGEITVAGFGGSGSYTYAISPSAGTTLTGNVFSNVPFGTYTITITDLATSCTSDATVTLEPATPVTFTTTVNDVSCNGGSNGTITVNLPASNNNPIYTYEIIAPITVAPQTSNVFTGLAFGNYSVRVHSGRGCFDTQTVSVGEPDLLAVSGTATDFSCAIDNSVNTAILTIAESGGTAPFTYSIDGVNYLSTNTFDIIDTGSVQNINIFVKDANGCIDTNTVAINPLTVITATAVTIATPIDCNGTGSVSINVTGGSGNFSYQMLPSGTVQTSNIFNITAPGDYYFRVNDIDTGCYKETLPFTVNPFNNAEVVLSPTTAVTCFGDLNGAFEINVNDYSGAYNYEVFNSSGVSINGITAANTSINPEVVSGMPAGNLTVVITETESPFCVVSSNVITIDSPTEALTVTATQTSSVTCDNNKGTITAIAHGGWGTYEYELTGTATVAYTTNGTFTNLSAGTYTVNVRDASGCIASDGEILTIPTQINATVTASTNTLSCFGDTNASITASVVTGGEGSNYSYTLNMLSPTVTSSGPQTASTFTNLGVGTYTVTITDGYNCEFTSANIVITEPSPIEASLVKNTSQTCLTGASLTLSASGGTGTYEYSESETFTTILGSFATSTTFSVTDGIYQYYVRDVNGCMSNVSNQIAIDPLPTLMVNLEAENIEINCTGDEIGTIYATAEGGLGNYVYTLQDTSGTAIVPVTQDSPGVFTNLPAGNYQVQVESGDCLATSNQISITEPLAPLTVVYNVENITCPGINNGSIEINANGGTGIIKYAISPRLDQFFETNIFDELAPGVYQAVVQDELGCFVIIDFEVEDATPVMVTIVPNSIMPEVCDGDMDGEFSISISGGNMPYSVAIDDINGTYTTGTTTQTDFDFTNLSGGDHLVFVRDALGCETEWNINFPEAVRIDPEVDLDYGCENNQFTNTVTVTVDESITNPADLDYALNGGAYQTSNVFTNVPSGLNNIIEVRHTNGCIKSTLPFDITDYQPLALALSDGNLNEIVATATGGSGIYDYDVKYEFSSNSEPYGSTNTFIYYESGEYTVTVTDSFGCSVSATRYFEFIDVCITNYFTPNGDGVLDGWGPGCTTNYDDLTFDIFDRYGRKVATLGAGEKWDGKYHGKELPTGDYWYVVKLNDKKDDRSFVGNFTLYR
ncbi:T9SS type B sorting domain-containing protein [Postechiella marina]|uniref:T9SS type B sorting domain-containing protein n=1 Tax=Postechiella marina TaxID=943941 RepID=A0ABP8CBM7_9FLAO